MSFQIVSRPLKKVAAKAHIRRAATTATNRELLTFGVPALALWIAGPVLTLIDTAAVGRFSQESALNIASLGPATSLCDATGYVFAFLNVAATNLLASSSDEERPAVAGRGVMWALVCGLSTTLLLRAGCGAILKIFIGSASSSVVARSQTYVKVRSLGMVFVLLSNVLTASLLGAKDSLSPLKAQGSAAIVNVLGDLLAVAVLTRGVRGAAEATVAAQIVTATFLARAASKRVGIRIKQPMPKGKKYSTFFGPVLVLVFAKIASFASMTYAASELGENTLAAHQLSFTLYLTASLVLEALAGQTAQAFVPPLVASEKRDSCVQVAGKIRRIAYVAAVITSLGAFLVCTFGCGLFTSDKGVAKGLAAMALPLALSVIFHGPIAHGEGMLVALGDIKTVGAVYFLSALLFPPLLIFAARTGRLNDAPSAVWALFASFQLVRAVFFQFRTNKLLDRPKLPETP